MFKSQFLGNLCRFLYPIAPAHVQEEQVGWLAIRASAAASNTRPFLCASRFDSVPLPPRFARQSPPRPPMPENTHLRASSCLALLILLSIAGICGCAQMKTATTARTGAEQLLISNSVDQALNKVDWTPFHGKSVFIEEKYVDCVDKAYVIGSIRHRVATAGGKLAAAADKSDIVVEVRSGGVGTDISDAFVGIPAVTVPGFLTLPDIRFVTHQLETGTAKIGLIAYDAKTRKVLGDGGMSLA